MPSVAELVVQGLVEGGVERLFGVPGGGSNLEILEAARARGLPFVLCHQESAACIMAAVTGELTGRPGAVLATLGPGVTASATGIAHACLDRAPVILITDRHAEAVLGFVTHQRVDHQAHLGPIVKQSVALTAASAPAQIARALELATGDPRGPVHLDLAPDVARAEARPGGSSGPSTHAFSPLSDAELDRAAALIAGARRPVVIAGLQCRRADATWLRAFSEALPAPVFTTYKAKGAIPDPHPLAMGAFTGGVLEAPVLDRADLIIAFGLDTVELIPRCWSYPAPVLHLARCPWSAPAQRAPGGKDYYTPVAEVTGDLGSILEQLAPRLRQARADWDVAELDRLRREGLRVLEVEVPGLAPHRVVQRARALTPAGTIATVDAGAHMFPVTAYWQAVEPGECLISNGLATMGFALPAAVGAQLVHPERRVLCLTGDGGLMMVVSELETLARLGLPVIVLVFNDGALSLIEVKQAQRGYTGVPMRYEGPDLVGLARAFGLRAVSVSTEAALDAALASAQTAAGPMVIDARIDASGYRRTLEIVRGSSGA